MVVGLGALGAVTRIVLDAEPTYEVAQRVFEGLALGRAVRALRRDHRLRLQRQRVHALGRGRRPGVGQEPRDEPPEELFGARPATVERHPILGLDPVNCTAQLGVPGPWFDRLPHFRMGFTPSAGEELQSEYHVSRADAVGAIEALRGLGRDRPAAAPGVRDPHDRRRRAVDEPAVRARQRGDPLHLGARARRGAAGAGARSRRRWSRSNRARTGASCSCARRATRVRETSRGSPRDSIRAARSATSGRTVSV